MDQSKNQQFINSFWDEQVMPSLTEYVSIPNKSPMFDPDWEKNGYMTDAVNHMVDWVKAQGIEALTIEVHTLPGRTPTIVLTLEGDTDENILIYGHLDKQPEFDGWEDGLGPWKPVIKDEKLYGRGGADDGYAIYSAIAAIRSLMEQQMPRPRIVILIEASEESGSPDLPHYMEALEETIGTPSLVIALDSTCGNYDQLWLTTSLRGMLIADLSVRILLEGVHSGAAGGIVPSSFRILRSLVSRLEDENTGNIHPSFLNEQIPDHRRQEAIDAGKILSETFEDMYPFAGKAGPVSDDPTELVLNNTWLPSLAVTGIGGAPDPEAAGNVLRPETSARLALRLPPTTDALKAADELTKLLTSDAPYGAEVGLDMHTPNAGWHATETSVALQTSLDQASNAYFGAPSVAMGCGGSIPFMEFLAARTPSAQFVVTGVLGPRSNAHGPNEFLHLPTARKLTACVAELIRDAA
ncbi:MAG: M20/M25/M40 family metallo-hydrolase [Pseudomonadales bacterium]|nr:M20/M25/M40 family metallo-hydrolase [Pseudomonadales bacterium]MBO6702131.1 M20/M25/M40 family metallo-hydrolase [Pseudomonadales bacterium]MBO7006879.1 M20/M25/M40 family metallo-hydrolase [Pseudomonadales bacterium]